MSENLEISYLNQLVLLYEIIVPATVTINAALFYYVLLY